MKEKGLPIYDGFDALEKEKEAEQIYTSSMEKDSFIDHMLSYQKMENKVIEKKPCYNMFDLALVYLHTFLYMCNYYGLAATAAA